jgi:hypothetical protein
MHHWDRFAKEIEQDRSLIAFWQKVSFLDILSHLPISALSPLKQFRNHTEPRIYKTSFSPDSMTNELNDNTCDRRRSPTIPRLNSPQSLARCRPPHADFQRQFADKFAHMRWNPALGKPLWVSPTCNLQGDRLGCIGGISCVSTIHSIHV